MTNYQGRIREIQSAFVMGYQDRDTCIRMFEELLHDYDLLPNDQQLDRAVTNESFLSMLRAAKEHRDLPPQQAASQSIVNAATASQYRIADSVKQRCPVCERQVVALFNRVQTLDKETIPVDPPRCQECMMKWIEGKFAPLKNLKPEPHYVIQDPTPASPMKPDETDFFSMYEKQMQEEE